MTDSRSSLGRSPQVFTRRPAHIQPEPTSLAFVVDKNPSTDSSIAAADDVPSATRASRVEPLHQVEKRVILSTVTRVNGDIPRAAAALKIPVSTLYRKLKGYNSDRSHSLSKLEPWWVIEKRAIRSALRVSGGERKLAACYLQIPLNTLYRRLKTYDLEAEHEKAVLKWLRQQEGPVRTSEVHDCFPGIGLEALHRVLESLLSRNKVERLGPSAEAGQPRIQGPITSERVCWLAKSTKSVQAPVRARRFRS